MIKRYRLGCAIWKHSEWEHYCFSQKSSLQDYSSVFNTVEGNTSFYGLPSESTIQQWKQEVQEGFEFHFKIPKVITHEKQLISAQGEIEQFLKRMEPLGHYLGTYLLQLSPQFDVNGLSRLDHVLNQYHEAFGFCVEVRHLSFFDKGKGERALLDMLNKYQVNRVIFDSRPLFSVVAEDDATREAQRKKPRLPVHVYTTGNEPFIRYIGHPNLEHNESFLTQWVDKFVGWINQGKVPKMFIHTPSNADAPVLASRFHDLLSKKIDVGFLPEWPIKKNSHPTLF